LVLDVLLFEEQVVVDALHPQETEFAAARRVDSGELRGGAGAAGLSLLAANARRRPGRRLVLGLVLLFLTSQSTPGLMGVT
jgi:hypothetical protein